MPTGWSNQDLDEHFGLRKTGIKNTIVRRPEWLTDEVIIPRPTFAVIKDIEHQGTLPCLICGDRGIIYIDIRHAYQFGTCEQCGSVYNVKKTGMSSQGKPRYKYVFNETRTAHQGYHNRLSL